MIIVNVFPDLTQSLYRSKGSSNELNELVHVEDELGNALTPLHHGNNYRNLHPYFRVLASDLENAERILSRLKNCRGVEGTYIMPPDELAVNHNNNNNNNPVERLP